jgi:glutamyl-tRNA synthetase
MNNIRLRLAPSPTGFLHLGNLRTALFGYLLAKNLGGKFILRIEDTDQKREVEGAVDSLLDILAWVGITFDEGPHIGGDYGPYIQSQRLDIYKKYSDELLAKGGAYRCFCSADRLTKMREEQAANHLPPRYDRTCRNLSQADIEAKLKNNEPFVIRQSLPPEGEVKFTDELRGEISFKAEDLDDHVLIKSDGMPTYQFANVVDDHLMEISHITRGDEWLPSAPKNVLLYQAFGWEVPKLIHLPLILNKTGGKLSKRQGDVYVEDYKSKGYLPEALINFCAMLGWHSKTDKEIFTLAELVKEFTIEGLGASPAVFDLEKLDFYNGHYIRQKSDEELLKLLKPYLEDSPLERGGRRPGCVISLTDDYLLKIIPTIKERLKCLSEVADLTIFYFCEPEYEVDLLIWKSLSMENIKNNLQKLLVKLEDVEAGEWQTTKLENLVITWLKAEDQKLGDYLWPMRVALTGFKASPGPFEVAGVLGQELSLTRIKQAIDKV